jgi:HEAT repeat protein
MWAWLRRLFGGADDHRPSLAGLARQAAHANPGLRELAAVRLGESGEAAAAEPLLGLLGDTHSGVRAAALASLRWLGPAAAAALRQGLGHSDPAVGEACADLLAGLRDPDAVAPLLEALKFSPRPVQLASRRALERLGETALPALEASRSEPQPWVRRQIEEAIDTIRRASPT